MTEYITCSIGDHDCWYNRGEKLFQLGSYQEALSSFDQALDLEPDDSNAWILRGGVLTHLDCYEQALASFEKALEFKPNDKTALLFKGMALHQLGHYAKAFGSYERALGIKQQSIWQKLTQGWNRYVQSNILRISQSSPG